MVLLVFEGQKEEPKIMATIQQLFFPEKGQLLCSYGTDTYTLWKEVKEYSDNGFEVDVFSIVKKRMQARGDHSLDGYDSYKIDSIYLFFDYDPQNSKLGLERLNPAIESIIDTFSDPMAEGQIFISYPMVEALYCDSCISPASDYLSSVVSIADCHNFKQWVQRYTLARNKNLLLLKTDRRNVIVEKSDAERMVELNRLWKDIVIANAQKANYICNDSRLLPGRVDDILQIDIFRKQQADYVGATGNVSILSSFSLFLFDYFHGNGDF